MIKLERRHVEKKTRWRQVKGEYYNNGLPRTGEREGGGKRTGRDKGRRKRKGLDGKGE